VYQAEADGHMLKVIIMVEGLPCCQYCNQNHTGNKNVMMVVVLKHYSALCTGKHSLHIGCHRQCVKNAFVITWQYDGASQLQNYSSRNKQMIE
jgi:hypothetical protein